MKPAKMLSTVLMPAATLGLLLSLTGAVNAADPSQVARGAKEWAENCNRCHNYRAPDELTHDEWAVAVMHMRVRGNIPGNVADDIIAFLQASSPDRRATAAPRRTTRVANLSPGDPAHGEQVFMGTCVACHGADGKGAVAGAPNLAQRLASKSDSVLLSHMIHGFRTQGSAMDMPPRGGNPDLSDQDLADALAYIRNEFGS